MLIMNKFLDYIVNISKRISLTPRSSGPTGGSCYCERIAINNSSIALETPMYHLTAAAFAPMPIAAYAELSRLYLKAMRLWVMFARTGHNPRQALAGLLGDRPAARFSILMDSCVAAWPVPFTTFPPCACRVSPDEAALMALLDYAEANHAEKADALFVEMLPSTDRARLWQSALRCVAERIGAP